MPTETPIPASAWEYMVMYRIETPGRGGSWDHWWPPEVMMAATRLAKMVYDHLAQAQQ